MILKSERLAEAFARLVKNETDHAASFDDARLVGVCQHFYTTYRSGPGGYGTHYVVLGSSAASMTILGAGRLEAARPSRTRIAISR